MKTAVGAWEGFAWRILGKLSCLGLIAGCDQLGRKRHPFSSKAQQMPLVLADTHWAGAGGGLIPTLDSVPVSLDRLPGLLEKNLNLQPVSGSTCVRAQSLSRVQLFCDPIDCSPPGSSVHGTLKARMLAWDAMPSSRASSRPRDRTHVSWTGRWILHH